jgi:hypothetical protein
MVLPVDATRNLAVIALVLLVVLAFGWYVVSGQLERRRAAELCRVAYDLVRSLGTVGRLTWLRGGGCRFSIEGLRTPIARLQVVVRPAPRTFPIPVPWVDRRQDSRDLFAFAIDLAQAPTITFDVVEPDTSVGARALLRATSSGWRSEEIACERRRLVLVSPDLDQAKELLRKLPRAPGGAAIEVVRLAVSSVSPQLGLTVVYDDALSALGARFASWLNRLADYVDRSSTTKML